MKVDLAGSRAVVSIAATTQTDYDVQQNGASLATMRSAAGDTTASFMASSELVLAPGDVLSVIAPSIADATLTEIGFALAGTLVT